MHVVHVVGLPFQFSSAALFKLCCLTERKKVGTIEPVFGDQCYGKPPALAYIFEKKTYISVQ